MPIINHPIAGKVPVPDSLFVGDDQAEINARVNDYLAGVVAKALEEQGVEIPSSVAFSESAKRIGSETIRGVAESVNDQRTSTLEQDFMNLVSQKTNPYATFFGGLFGGAGDPTNVVPEPFSKIKMLKKVFGPLMNSKSYLWEAIKKDTAVGALFGALAPDREDYGEGTLDNIMYSALGSSGFGALRGVFGKLSGAKTDTEIKAILDELNASELQALDEALNTAGRTLNETEAQYSQSTQPMSPSSGQVDEFVPPMADPAVRAQELNDIRRVGDEAEAARKAEQEAELERIRNIGKEAELERIKQVGEDFDINADIKKQIADMEEDIAALPSSAKQARFTKDQAQIKNEIGQLDTKINNLRKAYNKLSTAKKSPDKKVKMAAVQEQINKAQARRTQRLGELDFIKKQPERFKQLKEAKKEIIKYKKDGTVPSFVKINEPTTRTDVNVDEALAAKASQLGYKSPQPQQYVPEQPAPERPVQSLSEAPTAMPDMSVPELGPKSAGSMGVSIKPSAKLLSRVANFDRRTTETKEMAERLKLKGKPAGAAGKEVPESKEAFQREALQKADEEWSGYWQMDGITGKITMDKVGREAEFLRADINDAINEGNYRNAADWLVQTYEKRGTLLASEVNVAQQLFAIADNNIRAGLEALKRIEANDGLADDKTIAIMHGMQMDNAVRDVAKFLGDMRTIQRVEEGVKSGWSAVGRELKRVKRLNEEQYKQYKKNRVITQLILGVKCK